MGLLSRAVLIGVSAAILVAPAALADPVGGGTPGTEQPAQTVKERIAAYTKRVEQIEADLKKAADAAHSASTKAEARTAKDDAVQVKDAATKLQQELQKFLDEPLEWTTDDRVATARVLSRAQKAEEGAAAAIKVAQEKIDKPEEPTPAAEIAVEPNSVGRGGIVAIVVFCPEGKVDNFASDAVTIVPESRFEEGPVTAIGGIVKQDATIGKHTATATCGKEKLTASFTVTADAPVPAKPPTSDDVRRKAIVKPKGKIETGGGATALQTV